MRYQRFAVLAALGLAVWMFRGRDPPVDPRTYGRPMDESPSNDSRRAAQPPVRQDPAVRRSEGTNDAGGGEKARHVVGADFCAALVDNDRPALRQIVDAHLKSLPSTESVRSRVEMLKRWIAGRPCVASAELVPVLLDTEPPVQQIRVVLAGEGHAPPHRSIGIVLDPSGPRFNYR